MTYQTCSRPLSCPSHQSFSLPRRIANMIFQVLFDAVSRDLCACMSASLRLGTLGIGSKIVLQAIFTSLRAPEHKDSNFLESNQSHLFKHYTKIHKTHGKKMLLVLLDSSKPCLSSYKSSAQERVENLELDSQDSFVKAYRESVEICPCPSVLETQNKFSESLLSLCIICLLLSKPHFH